MATTSNEKIASYSTERINDTKIESDSEEGEVDEEARQASLSKLLTLAKPEWGVLFVAFLLMAASEAVGLFNPILVADAYNFLVDPNIDSDEKMSEISEIMAMVLIFHGAGVLGGFLRAAIMQVAGERVVARLRNRLYRSILNQEIAFFDSTKSGELVSRLSSDTTLLQKATSQAVPEVMVGLVKLIACVALMFWLSPELAGVSIGCVIVVFLVVAPFGTWIGKLSKRYQDVLSLAQTYSTEALGSIRTVQSFAAEDREAKRYEHVIGNPDWYTRWWPTDRNDHETTYSVGFVKGIVTSGFFTIIFGVGFGCLYISLW